MNIKINVIFAALIASGAMATSCSQIESDTEITPAESFVTVQLADYETSGENIQGENDLDDLQACLFENGRMTQVYDQPVASTSGYGFRIPRETGTLYVLTNTTAISDLKSLCQTGISEQEWLSMTAGTAQGLPIRFFSGSTTLSKEAKVKLTRGVARFDLHIRTVGPAQIEQLTLEGAALRTGIIAGKDPVATDRGDITFRPDSPYTKDTPGVAYVYEQTNSDLVLRADAIVNGKRYELEAKLPESIRRNCIYIVTLLKDVADQEAQLTVEPWENGGDIGMIPDWNGQIIVDTDQSELPSGAVVSDDKTTLTLPHDPTELTLVLDCNDELELIPVTGYPLTIEPDNSTRGVDGKNRFRVSKPLYVPGKPADEIILQFRRQGLNETYPEDQIVLHLSANPVRLEGPISFDMENHSFDFGRYVENELGRFILPADKELAVEFEEGEDPWVQLSPIGNEAQTIRVLGGWKPNDPSANGRTQTATLVIRNTNDGSGREEYRISRRNYGLPVTWFHGVWWCKYNARGNSRSFDDQILSSADPAAAAGKSVFDYLRDCSPEEFYNLWGWAYQGDSGIGMRVVEKNGILVMEGFSTNVSAHINKLPANTLAPDGYELPSMEEFNRVFDATDYIWMMWNGTHHLRSPWEGHYQVKREQRRRNDIQVGTIQATDLLYCKMWSPDFPEQEPITWYGPGAQWNAEGILHSNHYNNILFSVYSPEGSGWYINGSMAGLYMHKNGAGNKDTRILRFKKSPVEYIYGE